MHVQKVNKRVPTCNKFKLIIPMFSNDNNLILKYFRTLQNNEHFDKCFALRLNVTIFGHQKTSQR